jgi:hypothetical protein
VTVIRCGSLLRKTRFSSFQIAEVGDDAVTEEFMGRVGQDGVDEQGFSIKGREKKARRMPKEGGQRGESSSKVGAL